ncbi:[protein-PII] uridylyltransferase [Propionibacteriaceae bacterium ES.041]|uniref:Phosphohydrolase n=1 Tax=Enemella evansiae TaxID=2016499 RepID=A0A255GF59_9ACTN|nr:HD domain-containing protein [Enemella evansiae]OYN94602.1 phosphohydrolase [Enemella evansiae]OYO14498.1 phosphohydrolase [Enemella evansiae]PFG67664.1 [protein-PII] uridylyltransferase [Propionibacteriaceae bacterium ES.041]
MPGDALPDPEIGIRERADRSRRTAEWLAGLWAGADAPAEGVALACTGSLARREPGPRSDLDLIVLHAPGVDPGRVAAIADGIWYPIWDSGNALDHAVRSIKQCRQVAAADLNVAGALLELAPVAGDADLVRRAVRQLAEDWRANARKRLPELVQQITARHELSGELAQLLEPDLKEAKGGLRDMSILRALTGSWLADRPHGAVDAAYTFLLDVRDALQQVTGRPRNLLTLNDQDEVAERLGLGDADELLTRVGHAARRISAAADATLRRASQSQRARLARRGPRRPELTPLHPGLYAHDGELVLGPVRGGPPDADELVPLRAAALSASRDLPLAPVTARNLAALPAPATPWSPPARELFGELLAGPGLLHTWNTLDLAGVVDGWLPDWAGIRDRPQRNPLHRHTVDRHSLATVLEAQHLVGRVQRPDLLLLAALLHDIGKRPGAGDHAEVGAALVRRITADLGLPDADADQLTLLVAEHLTLMALATGEDTTDPATAAELGRRVHDDPETLKLLAALTEADSRAAGPRTWTSGRAALARDLTARTLALLERQRADREPAAG